MMILDNKKIALSTPCLQFISVCSIALIVSIVAHIGYQQINYKWVLYSKGVQAFQRHDWPAATRYLEESIKLGKTIPKAFLRLADAYYAMNLYSSAIPWYKAYLAVKPDDLWARKAYAGALTAVGNFDDAAKEYQMILHLSTPHE